MPRIMRDCAFCGRQMNVYVDEDGEVLSDALFMGLDPAGQERWACNACQRYAKTTPEAQPTVDRPQQVRPLDDLEILPNPVDSGFCQWFAGWTDARGHFGLRVRGNRFLWVYETQTSAAEKRALEHIRQELGFGRILSKPQHVTPATQYQFIVQDREGVEVLMVIFEHFALQNPQRQAQFQVWCEAFDFDRKQGKQDASYLQAMRAYSRRLAKLEKAKPAPPRQKTKAQQRDSGKEPSLFDAT